MLLMGYVFNNPGSVFKAINSVSDRFLQGQDYEENEEFFLQGMDEVSITSRSVEIDLRTYTGSTLKIALKGQIPRFEQGPFILQSTENNQLRLEIQEPLASHWIQMNINGEELTKATDSKLKAEIYIPQNYRKLLRIESREGQVHLQLPEDSLYELDLQSISGNISNTLKQKPTSEVNPQEVGRIQIHTIEGPITVEPLN